MANLPKGKAVKERGTDMQRELVVDVVCVAPNRDVHALSYELHLFPERHREFVAVILGARRLGGGVSDDVV